MSPADLKALVRTVPDFPARGIQCRRLLTPRVSETLSYCTRLLHDKVETNETWVCKVISLTVKWPCGR